MLTDTTFWVDLFSERRKNRAGPVTQFISKHRAYTLSISIITWGELAAAFDEADTLNFTLRNVNVLPLPKHVVWEASRVQRQLAQRLGENDVWIAATALVWGKRLVTRDNAFKRVPKLTVVSY